MTTLKLTAAHADHLLLTLSPQLAAAAVEGRTIAGVALVYGPIGQTSIGPVRVRAGAIRVPEDLRRVKLVRRHLHVRLTHRRDTWAALADRPRHIAHDLSADFELVGNRLGVRLPMCQ